MYAIQLSSDDQSHQGLSVPSFSRQLPRLKQFIPRHSLCLDTAAYLAASAVLTSPLPGWDGKIFSPAKEILSARPYYNITGQTLIIMTTSFNSAQLSLGDTLTSSAGDFPASHSARPESERAKRMTATSSRRLAELLQKQGQSGSFLKTLLACSAFSNQTVYLKWKLKRLSFFVRTVTTGRTVPLSGSSAELSEASFQRSVPQDMYYRSLKTAHQSFCVFRLLPLTPRTKGTGSGLLPTPTATEISNIGTTTAQVKQGRELADRKNDKGTGGQVSLTDFLIYYTLQAQSTPYPPAPENMPVSILDRLIRILPTAEQTGSTRFPAGKHGQLNPRFVAEMMGFPPNWTELPFLPGVGKV
nr:hypothetical protein [Arcticibacter tournemirensis]